LSYAITFPIDKLSYCSLDICQLKLVSGMDTLQHMMKW